MEKSMSVLRRVLAAMTTLAVASTTAFAQLPDYSKPKSALNPIAPYTGRDVPQPNLSNSNRVDATIRDGKMMLSLNDAIALALENNLDLAIARYNLNIADTDLLRTKAGGTPRGVSTGIVQGTPGGATTGGTSAGTTGGGTGGTSTGAGGAGTGTGGLVTSTLGTVGSSLPSFDPFLSGSLTLERSSTPLSNSVVTGVPQLNSNTGGGQFNYNQGFATGTNLQVGFSSNRQATNARSLFQPVLNSNLRATISQHLLQGFGFANNLRGIRVAKNNREISDIAFRLQVISTVSQIENIYWNLVSAYEDLRAKQRALDLANRLLSDNQKQVQIGTLAPIEVVRAQSEVSARKQDVIISQTNLQLQQLQIKNALTRNTSDPLLTAAEVIPTDTMKLVDVEPVEPTEDLIREALAHRAELAEAQIDLTNRDITKKAARNALLPTLDLVAFYGTSALGGDPSLSQFCGQPGANTATCLQAAPPSSTGFGGNLNSLFSGDFPDKGAGFNMQIPIRNRAAQADQVRSELEYRQAQMRLAQLQNQIRIEVRNAQFAVQQNRARVDAAITGRQLAAESLDAENKKYALGASTNFNVLQAQRDLATAESNLVGATSAYEQSKVELDRVTARTLQSLGIDIQDAETANVTRMPSVPSVVPRTDLGPTSRQAPAANPQQPTGQVQIQAQPQTPAQAQMQAAPQAASATPRK
jgi:outer membrane protein